jgi:undecaprenyl-diphosphatase
LPILHLVVLALVQGITEFLPVSSSAHLVVVPHLTDWPDQGLLIDVAVHVGTLGAVMLYCWREIGEMLMGLARLFRGRRSAGLTLALQLIVATVPVVIAGYLVARYAGDMLRSLEVIAWATIGFALLLWIADRVGLTVRRLEHLGYIDAVVIGLAQAVALIPGTSRSGITMTAARMLGFERPDTARFSLLLSIPAILGAGVLEGQKLLQSGDLALGRDAALAAGLAFLSALVAVALMMAWLRRASFTPFVLYRLLMGAALLWLVYG